MSSDQAKQMLQQGIAAARAGQKAEARQYLQEAVKRDPRSESAWLWLSSVAADDQERIFCLKQLYGINPNNENAVKGLRLLGVELPSSPSVPDNPPDPSSALTPPERPSRTVRPLKSVADSPSATPPESNPTGETPERPSRTVRSLKTATDRPSGSIPTQQPPQQTDVSGYSEPSERPSRSVKPLKRATQQVDPSSTPNPQQTERSSGAIRTPNPESPSRGISSQRPSERPSGQSAIQSSGPFADRISPSGGIASQQPPVPIVDERRLTASMAQLDPILLNYQPMPTASLPFQWTKKTRGRVGDSSANALRIGVILVALVVLVGIVGGGFFVLRQLGGTQFVVIAGTPTATFPPTATLTPSPGFTPTPSVTPQVSLTPTPVPLTLTPGSFVRQATPGYPAFPDSKGAQEAQVLIFNGQYDQALPTFEFERKSLENDKKSSAYYSVIYTMAQAYVDQGNVSKAQALLNDNKEPTSPFYRAALASVEFAQKDSDSALTDANAALDKDPKLVSAVILASRINVQKGNYAEARRVLKKALEADPSNTVLLSELGKTQLASGDPAGALAQAQLVLYVDPTNRTGYILRNQALSAIAASQNGDARIQAYGTAVLAAQEFLFHFPGDTLAWMVLGQAREGEGNYSAAIDAYTQAVVVDQKSPEAQQVFLARGNLYLNDRSYKEALADFNRALSISETQDARSLHLQAARGAGDYVTALDDADALFKAHPDDKDVILTRVDLLIRAWSNKSIDNDQFSSASSLISDDLIKNSDSTWNKDGRNGTATIRLYRGLARFLNGSYKDAVTDLDNSLSALDTGLGHYYRGQALEALNRPTDALNDYQWILTWTSVYNFPFANDVTTRSNQLAGNVQSATQAPIPTDTNTPPPTLTPVPTRTPIPSRTPVPSRTPKPSNTPIS